MRTGLWNLGRQIQINPSGDLFGGIMAAVVALPLCLAFGVASGLGAPAGLYGAIACGIFAALFGGTPGQCSGPTGPMTVVAAAMYSSNPSRPELIFAAIMMAGVLQVCMGVAKAGSFISYVPYPVISGFMTGIGAIIVCIEIAPFFGMSTSGNALLALQNIPELPKHFNHQAMLMGILALVIMIILPKLSRRLPASLIALLVTTYLSFVLDMKIPRIGDIPSGLPFPTIPQIGFSDLHIVLQSALTLAFLGAIDSLLTSVVLDKVTNRRHNSDQELVGQGIGNCVSGLFGGLPGAGATMRSMVNVKAGGTTALSGVIHGVMLLAILVCFGQAASLIPLATLAAILLVVGVSIMDWRVLRRLAKIPKTDALVMIVVLALTIFVDLIVAVLVGVALASVLFAKNLTDVKSSLISNLHAINDPVLVESKIPQAVREQIYSYALNGPLFFGEARNLTDAIDELAEAKYVLLHFVNVPLVDQTGAYALENAIEKWEDKGIKILFVGMEPHIKGILEDTGALHKIEMDNCFERFADAIKSIENYELGLSGRESGEISI